MKITKKSFIEELTSNKSYFIGVSKKLLTKDDVYCRCSGIFDDDIILELRTAKARSKSLKFNTGSILRFDQYGKYSFYRYQYDTNKYILICLHTYYDDFDDINRYNAMYYYINLKNQ